MRFAIATIEMFVSKQRYDVTRPSAVLRSCFWRVVCVCLSNVFNKVGILYFKIFLILVQSVKRVQLFRTMSKVYIQDFTQESAIPTSFSSSVSATYRAHSTKLCTDGPALWYMYLTVLFHAFTPNGSWTFWPDQQNPTAYSIQLQFCCGAMRLRNFWMCN